MMNGYSGNAFTVKIESFRLIRYSDSSGDALIEREMILGKDQNSRGSAIYAETISWTDDRVVTQEDRGKILAAVKEAFDALEHYYEIE